MRIFAGFAVALVIPLAACSGAGEPVAATTPLPTVTETVRIPAKAITLPAPPPVTVTVTETVTVAGASTDKITDGMWTVGVDVPPGTYKTIQAVAGSCYWGIYTTGTNQNDIVANDIVSGGYPQVELREGQDFESNRCGIWGKVG